MEANRSRVRWTYEEYVRLPSEGGTRYEVIDDELVVMPSPGGPHQRTVSKLVRVLGTFVHEHGLGEVLPSPLDVLFGEGDYLQPDIVFIRADRADIVSARGIEGRPDLVVEILSPSTADRDRGIKLDRYRHFGVPAYWIVDIDQRAVEVWRLAEGASEPEILAEGGHLDWTPVPGGPSQQVAVADILP